MASDLPTAYGIKHGSVMGLTPNLKLLVFSGIAHFLRVLPGHIALAPVIVSCMKGMHGVVIALKACKGFGEMFSW